MDSDYSDDLSFYQGNLNLVGSDYGFVSDYNCNLADGQWHFVVGTISGGTADLYVDGVFSATTETSLSGSSGDLYIGSRGGCDTFYQGSMSETLIFNRVLSSSEIAALYAGPAAGPTAIPARPLGPRPGTPAGTITGDEAATPAWPSSPTGSIVAVNPYSATDPIVRDDDTGAPMERRSPASGHSTAPPWRCSPRVRFYLGGRRMRQQRGDFHLHPGPLQLRRQPRSVVRHQQRNGNRRTVELSACQAARATGRRYCAGGYQTGPQFRGLIWLWLVSRPPAIYGLKPNAVIVSEFGEEMKTIWIKAVRLLGKKIAEIVPKGIPIFAGDPVLI